MRGLIVLLLIGLGRPCLADVESSSATFCSIRGELFVNGSAFAPTQPGRPADWTFAFQKDDLGREVIEKFDLLHGKYMHLVVVSPDLEHFVHLHPAWDEKNGVFAIRINEASSDPDNQEASSVISKPGNYMVFAEVKPRGGPSCLVRLEAPAEDAASSAPPEADLRAGRLVKYFDSGATPGKPGDRYEATLSLATAAGARSLEFDLRERSGSGYARIEGLERWLGMAGHAILVGAAGVRVKDKAFAHLHAMAEDGRADLLFPLNLRPNPPPGVYKVWVQVKRAGKILTFPFVIRI